MYPHHAKMAKFVENITEGFFFKSHDIDPIMILLSFMPIWYCLLLSYKLHKPFATLPIYMHLLSGLNKTLPSNKIKYG